MKIEYIKIFPHNIISGITLRNIKEYPPYGFSISKTDLIDESTINNNRKALSEIIEIPFEKLKFQKQVHGDKVRIITKQSLIEDSDAMITSDKGIYLSISIADCAAVLLHDFKNNVIAGIHSGWRGTKLNIVSKTIETMENIFETESENLIAYISPCASGEKYEVREDVAKYFPNSIKKIDDEKYLFDNKNELRNQLINAGLLQKNIHISKICTIQNENYHSFRRDKESSGRMSVFIGMNY